MALSNIFREPRREIIETAIGLAAIVLAACLVVPADYFLATRVLPLVGPKIEGTEDLIFVMTVVVPVCLVGALCAGLITDGWRVTYANQHLRRGTRQC